MSSKLESYLSTITKTNRNLSELIDYKKIYKNVNDILIDLNQLNYIIANNKKVIKENIKYLYNKNPDVFKICKIFLGIRNDDVNYQFKWNDKILSIDDFLKSANSIIDLLEQTNIISLIEQGFIKNFVDYVTGIEVGMDTNSRKNRYGLEGEKSILKKLEEIFKNRKEIEINKQSKIYLNDKIVSQKKFDFIIKNKITNQEILIETSFYNTSGSKINETSKSFKEINERIKKYPNIKFIWIADGKGMESIKKILSEIIEDDFIMNREQFFSRISKLI